MSAGDILAVKNLSVTVAKKIVLDNVSLTLARKEVIALTGVNGSGKSSLAMCLLGSSDYEVSQGTVDFDGFDLLEKSVDERSIAGVFVAWQNPIVIPGVSVFALAKAAYFLRDKKIESLVSFKQKLERLLIRVGLGAELLGRSINEGFSGGEKKRLELFWLLLLEPKLIILDEIDSGLDVGGRDLVAEVINELRQRDATVILITHYPDLIAKINVDRVVELEKGRVINDYRMPR